MRPKVNCVLLSITFLLSLAVTAVAQTPTSTDVMRDRISSAKAHLVVKNYTAAIYELENIRRETNDRTINRVINVLLMHAYLEQGDYKRTKRFLNELYKSKKPNASLEYIAVAAQVVSGAKTQLKRYQVLGLDVSDEKLPSYAAEDLEQMRKILEMIVGQSKTLRKDKKLASNSLALLEETSTARGNLARDEYDAKRWENEIVYARQQIANSGSRVINAVGDAPITAPDPNLVAAKSVVPRPVDDASDSSPKSSPEPVDDTEKNAAEKTVEKPKEDIVTDQPVGRETADKDPVKVKEIPKTEQPKPLKNSPQPKDRKIRIIGSAARTSNPDSRRIDSEGSPKKERTKEKKKREQPKSRNTASKEGGKSDSPVSIGSLIGYATKRVSPVYPRQARSLRMSGIVKVKLVVDEDGRVAKVEKTEGPTLLKRAAQDAVRKWQFRPFKRNGQPVKATGFVSFNFNL